MSNEILYSKVLTQNHLPIIYSIVSGCGKIAQEDFYNLGYPVSNPPKVRGSIVLVLHDFFFTDNLSNIDFISPIDTGGIERNMLLPLCMEKDVRTDLLSKTKHPPTQLRDFIFTLNKIHPEAIFPLLRHQYTPNIKTILELFFDTQVVTTMIQTNDPHAWLFEVKMRVNYRIDISHVSKIYIPNTYTDLEIFRKIYNLKPEVVRTYNPKYGIEQAISCY